jgi:hypothetical protein
MFATPSNDLQTFIQFAQSQLSDNPLSPEQCLTLYRLQHPSAEQRSADVAAVKEALAAIRAGDAGKPIEDFDQELRQRFHLAEDA